MKRVAPTPKVLPEKAPSIIPGTTHVAFNPDDLRAFANLMYVTGNVYEKLALEAANQNDEANFTIFQARHKLSVAFAERLAEAYRMPEPISREIH